MRRLRGGDAERRNTALRHFVGSVATGAPPDSDESAGSRGKRRQTR